MTTGSRSFQFDRLLEALDSIDFPSLFPERVEVLAQIGASGYRPKHFEWVEFLSREEFCELMGAADIVVTHGGTGAVISAITAGKRVVAVPRLAEHHEAVDDHQVELITQFDEIGLLKGCLDLGKLAEAIKEASTRDFVPYVSNTQRVLDSIDGWLAAEYCSQPGNGPIRVLMCGSALDEPGGMTSVCLQLVGHEWPDDITIDYVPTHVSGNPLRKALFFAAAYSRISRMLKGGEVSLVHAHMSYKGSFARKYAIYRLCRRRDIPFVVHLHGSEFRKFYKEGSERLKRQIVDMLNGSSCVIALGDAWRDFVLGIAPSARVEVLPNTVPFAGIRERPRNKGAFTVTFMGLLIRRKGVSDLLEAFARFLDENPDADAILNVAGSGEERESLEAQTSSLGISKQVKFLGWIDGSKRSSILDESDVFVLPSYNEGLPIALLEAMSAGVPPIVSDVGSVSEAVTDGVEGCLVKPGDITGISSAMTRLYSDEVFWNSASLSSMQRISEAFSEERYFERITGLYERVGQVLI